MALLLKPVTRSHPLRHHHPSFSSVLHLETEPGAHTSLRPTAVRIASLSDFIQSTDVIITHLLRPCRVIGTLVVSDPNESRES